MSDNVPIKTTAAKAPREKAPREKKAKAKPTQPLPSGRIAFEKQTELLRAWGTASGPERKPVTNKTVAEILGMPESTTFQLNSFLQEIGFLSRGEGGLVASADLAAYASAAKWGDPNAARKLAPTFGATWFGKALLQRLQFRALDEQQAMRDLAAAASADPEYRNPIKMCIDYLEFAGLVERDGGMLKEGPAAHSDTNLGQQQTPPAPPPSALTQNQAPSPQRSVVETAGDVTAEALTRLLKRKPSKNVQDAVWTLIRYLTIGEDEKADENGGSEQ